MEDACDEWRRMVSGNGTNLLTFTVFRSGLGSVAGIGFGYGGLTINHTGPPGAPHRTAPDHFQNY